MQEITKNLYLDREELKGVVSGYIDDDKGYISRVIPAINGDMNLSETGTSYGGFYWSMTPETFFAQNGHIGDIGWGQDYPRLNQGELEHTPFFTKKFAQSVLVSKESLRVPPVKMLNKVGKSLLQLRSVVRGMAEREVVSLLTTAANWTNKSTAAHSWSTTGDPVSDISTAIDKVAELADPDTIILGRAAFRALLDNKAWNETRPYGDDRATSLSKPGQQLNELRPDQLNYLKEMIARRFGLKQCIFATARWNASATKATTTIANQFGDNCWIGRVGEFTEMDVINNDGGFEISPRAFFKAAAGDIEFEEEEHLGKIELGASQHVGFKIVDDRIGYLIQKCAATS